MIGGVTIWEIDWTAGLPHLSGLPYLPGVTYLHVINPYSVRENVEQNKRDFERGYPLTLVQEILTVLSSPTETMLFATKQNKQKRFYCFLQVPTIPTIRPHPISKEFLWTLDIIQQQPKLKHIFNRVIDCLLQEGKISQEHSSQRENSVNLATITKSTKRLKVK